MAVFQREHLRLGHRRGVFISRPFANSMSLNLDTEIVATAYDPATDTCAYTIARNGQRWTVEVPLVQLEGHGANKDARRAHLANLLTAAMQGLPDAASDPGQGSQGDADA